MGLCQPACPGYLTERPSAPPINGLVGEADCRQRNHQCLITDKLMWVPSGTSISFPHNPMKTKQDFSVGHKTLSNGEMVVWINWKTGSTQAGFALSPACGEQLVDAIVNEIDKLGERKPERP